MYKWNWEVPRRETCRSQTATDVVVRLNSPWAPGHFCGVSIVLVVVCSTSLSFLCRDSPDKGSVSCFGR